MEATDVLNSSMAIAGPIGAFVVVGTIALVVIYRHVLQPLLAAVSEAAAANAQSAAANAQSAASNARSSEANAQTAQILKSAMDELLHAGLNK